MVLSLQTLAQCADTESDWCCETKTVWLTRLDMYVHVKVYCGQGVTYILVKVYPLFTVLPSTIMLICLLSGMYHLKFSRKFE